MEQELELASDFTMRPDTGTHHHVDTSLSTAEQLSHLKLRYPNIFMKNAPRDSESTSNPRSALDALQFVVSLVIVIGALTWLLWAPNSSNTQTNTPTTTKEPQSAEVSSSTSVRVKADSPLGQRLQLHSVKHEKTSAALLVASGRVIASRRPGVKSGEAPFWQFSSGELLDSFTAWQKAKLSAEFEETQLKQVQELATARENGINKSIERLERLVHTGTVTEKALVEANTLLLQTKIEDQQKIFDAQIELKTSQQLSNNQYLQLQQFGLSPELLMDAPLEMDIVSAEVPEAMVSLVAIGQSCVAEFYGIPNVTFDGKVTSLSPVLNAELRTLRVLFVVRDPQDLLRPGMFAKIGVGTDNRDVIKIPSDAVIHSGAKDLVLVRTAASENSEWLNFEIRDVAVQEQIDSAVEVRTGLAEGETVVGKNAILLKPLVARARAIPATRTPSSNSLGSN